MLHRVFSVGLVLFFTTALSATSAQAGFWSEDQSLGGFSNVHVYTPDSNSPVGPNAVRALLVTLHGCAQTNDAFLTAQLEDAAEAYGMVLALPNVQSPSGFGCWHYWAAQKARDAGDYEKLIALAEALVADIDYRIDPNQVYIAGLSSGATFAHTTACLAPDVFAGVAVGSGPSIGTSSNGALGPCETADVAQRCAQYAGSTYGPFLETQIASLAHGDADTTVNQCYLTQNSEGMAELYGVSDSVTTALADDLTRTASEKLWTNGRVSELTLEGLDHAWSGGEGASGSYISSASINYATYLGAYFSTYNQRLGPPVNAPTIGALEVEVDGDIVNVSATVTDDGTVVSVWAEVRTDDGTQLVEEFELTGSAEVSGISGTLAEGYYRVTVRATDDEGNVSAASSDSFTIGDPAPAAVEGTLDDHIAEGRLDFPNYADCYLEYGDEVFAVSEVVVADGCQWQDDDGSCQGPIVECLGANESDGGPIDTDGGDAEADAGLVDGGVFEGDGGRSDGGSSDVDASFVDGGLSSPDAGAIPEDAGESEVDSGAADGGVDGGVDDDGDGDDVGGNSCRCVGASPTPASGAALLGLLIMLRRRRRKARSCAAVR